VPDPERTKLLNRKHEYEFTETNGHLYEVTLKVQVEVSFTGTPSERELRLALVENAIEHLNMLIDIDQDEVLTRDLEYEHVDETSFVLELP